MSTEEERVRAARTASRRLGEMLTKWDGLLSTRERQIIATAQALTAMLGDLE